MGSKPKPSTLKAVAEAMDALAHDSDAPRTLRELAARSDLSVSTIKRVLVWERENGPSPHRLAARWEQVRSAAAFPTGESRHRQELAEVRSALAATTAERDDLLSYLFRSEVEDGGAHRRVSRLPPN